MTITLVHIDRGSPNPTLWASFTSDETVYAVAPVDPALLDIEGEWHRITEFCAILAADWLTGTRPATYGIAQYSDAQLAVAAQQLLDFGDLAGQVAYAQTRLGGSQAGPVDAVAVEIASGAAPVGTRIWAASGDHVVAAYVDGADSFLFYDPNNGNAVSKKRSEFASVMASYGVNLIVSAAPG